MTRGLGPALLGGSFLAEAALRYDWWLHEVSTAVLFAVIGAVGAIVTGLRSGQLARTGLWSCVVLPAAALAQLALNAVYNHVP